MFDRVGKISEKPQEGGGIHPLVCPRLEPKKTFIGGVYLFSGT